MNPTKIVIIGGTGLIGKQLSARLSGPGREILAASPSRGVNALTGEGLEAALEGAAIVIDVSNSPSFEDGPVMEFFQTSGRNLAAAERKAGVKHHIALSVVGTERLLASGYFRAKLEQERLIAESGIPHTIVRATQFFEFVPAIAWGSTVDGVARLPHALMRPIASADVAEILAGIAMEAPVNGIVEIAGPELIPMDDLIRTFLSHTGDARTVITDDSAGYFGTPVDDASLVSSSGAKLGKTHYQGWLGNLAA